MVIITINDNNGDESKNINSKKRVGMQHWGAKSKPERRALLL